MVWLENACNPSSSDSIRIRGGMCTAWVHFVLMIVRELINSIWLRSTHMFKHGYRTRLCTMESCCSRTQQDSDLLAVLYSMPLRVIPRFLSLSDNKYPNSVLCCVVLCGLPNRKSHLWWVLPIWEQDACIDHMELSCYLFPKPFRLSGFGVALSTMYRLSTTLLFFLLEQSQSHMVTRDSWWYEHRRLNCRRGGTNAIDDSAQDHALLRTSTGTANRLWSGSELTKKESRGIAKITVIGSSGTTSPRLGQNKQVGARCAHIFLLVLRREPHQVRQKGLLRDWVIYFKYWLWCAHRAWRRPRARIFMVRLILGEKP